MTGEDPGPGEAAAAGEGTASGEVPAAGGDTAAAERPAGVTPAGERSGTDAAPAAPPADTGSALDETDREILAIENLQWKYQGAKEMEIRRRLGLSPTHYYQRLNVLIDTRAALEHDPMLVGRLRRQRGDLG